MGLRENIVEDNKHIKKIYACSCWSEALEIQKEEDEDLISICMWQLGLRNQPRSFTERLRWIWKIITKGDYWSDECMLDLPTAKALGEDLIRLSTKPLEIH
jgi:hypothetical protein